ncbi:MAG: hypothetical protein ACFE68_03205 [Candidatus Hodarchaeota archaeon]
MSEGSSSSPSNFSFKMKRAKGPNRIFDEDLKAEVFQLESVPDPEGMPICDFSLVKTLDPPRKKIQVSFNIYIGFDHDGSFLTVISAGTKVIRKEFVSLLEDVPRERWGQLSFNVELPDISSEVELLFETFFEEEFVVKLANVSIE